MEPCLSFQTTSTKAHSQHSPSVPSFRWLWGTWIDYLRGSKHGRSMLTRLSIGSCSPWQSPSILSFNRTKFVVLLSSYIPGKQIVRHHQLQAIFFSSFLFFSTSIVPFHLAIPYTPRQDPSLTSFLFTKTERQTELDDLESLAYTLLFLENGELPWNAAMREAEEWALTREDARKAK